MKGVGAVGPGRQGHGSERGGPTGSFSMGGATNQRVASRAKWPRAQGQGCVPRARRALGFALLLGSEMSGWHDGTFTHRYGSLLRRREALCFKFKQPDQNLTLLHEYMTQHDAPFSCTSIWKTLEMNF